LLGINSRLDVVSVFSFFTFKVDLNKELDRILGYWVTPLGLIISILMAVCLVLFLSNQLHEISLPQMVLAIIVILILVTSWYYYRRLPTAKKGTIGFAISIATEKQEEHEKIARDLIDTLKGLLVNSKYKYPFSFVIFPEHYANKLDNREVARKYMNLARCHFMIYGRVRTRMVAKKETYLLETTGVVSHRPLPVEVSEMMGKEFAEIFPKKLQIPKDDDVLPFELTSEWISVVAKYMIGYAAQFSGDLDYAETLLEDVERELWQNKKNIPALNKIKSGLKIRLADVYDRQATIAHLRWRKTRSNNELYTVKKYLDKWEKVAPNKYRLRLLNSIYYFLVEHNTQKAKNELQKCKGIKDPVWQYNIAFLYAYDGYMASADRNYKQAFKRSKELISIEAEEFICWILEKEPDKIQLHYCLGLINYHDKCDYISAKKDFEKFIQLTNNGEFGKEISLAEQYLQDIEKGHVRSNVV